MGGTVNIITGIPFSSVTFNGGTNTFTITGINVTLMFNGGAILTVLGGSPNGGYRQVVSSTFTSGNTVVTSTSYSIGTAYPGPTNFTSGTGNLIWFLPGTSSSGWTHRSSGITQEILPMRFGNGVFLGLYTSFGGSTLNSSVVRSTDNGLTWSTVSITGNITGSPLVDIAYGAGAWLAVGGGVTGASKVYRSTDDGLTWTSITGLPNLGGGVANNAFPGAVSYQSGTWVVTQGQNTSPLTSQYMISTDGGLTWTLPGTFTCGQFYTAALLVDGTNFICPAIVSGFPAKICFSPNGSTWTAISAPPDFQFGATSIAFGNGVYVSINGSTETVCVSSTLTGLATAANTTIGLTGHTLNWISFGGGVFTVVDSGGGVTSSPDGITWTPSVLNLGVGDQAMTLANGGGSWVAGGLNGNISTLP